MKRHGPRVARRWRGQGARPRGRRAGDRTGGDGARNRVDAGPGKPCAQVGMSGAEISVSTPRGASPPVRVERCFAQSKTAARYTPTTVRADGIESRRRLASRRERAARGEFHAIRVPARTGSPCRAETPAAREYSAGARSPARRKMKRHGPRVARRWRGRGARPRGRRAGQAQFRNFSVERRATHADAGPGDAQASQGSGERGAISCPRCVAPPRRRVAAIHAGHVRVRGASFHRTGGSERSVQVMSVPAARHFTEQTGRSDPCRSCLCPQRVAPLRRRVGAIHAGHVRARSASLRCTGGSERSMQVMSVPAARRSAAQARSKGDPGTASDRPQSARRRAPPPRRFSSVRQVFRLWKRRRVHTKVAIFPGLPYNRYIILQTEEKAWKGFALTSTR